MLSSRVCIFLVLSLPFSYNLEIFKRPTPFITLPFGSSPALLILVPISQQFVILKNHHYHHGVFQNINTKLRDSTLIHDSNVLLVRSTPHTHFSFLEHPSIYLCWAESNPKTVKKAQPIVLEI